MKRIKIIHGTYGHRVGGNGVLRPKTVNDAPFEVTDDEAKRLVEMQVAVLADPVSGTACEDDTTLADTMLQFVCAAEDKGEAFRLIYQLMEHTASLVDVQLPDFIAPTAGDVNGGQVGDNPPEGENAAEGKEDADEQECIEEDTTEADVIDVVYEVPAYNAEMSIAELKEIMEQCGLTYKVGMSRAKMVAALDEYCATAEDAEELPELQTEEPVT